jgi:hypothetical protein
VRAVAKIGVCPIVSNGAKLAFGGMQKYCIFAFPKHNHTYFFLSDNQPCYG